MLRCGMARSGMVRNWGWAEGAEGALSALGADGGLGALGAVCAEGAFGALGADCAEGVLGALGAESAEGALGADCFAYAAFVAACAGSPRGTLVLPSCVARAGPRMEVPGLGGAGGPAIAATQQKKHARIWIFISMAPLLSIIYEDEMTSGIAPDPQQDVFVFGGLC